MISDPAFSQKENMANVGKEGHFVFVVWFWISRMEQRNVLNQKMDNICRICLREFHIMSSIFQKFDEEFEGSVVFLSLADKISSIAQVQLEEGDGLPQSICRSCQLQVDKLYEFKVLVEASDRTLRSYLQSENEADYLKSENKSENENFTTESLSDDKLNLDGVNAIVVPTKEGMDVWKICNVNKEEAEPESDFYENEVLSEFEPFDDASQLGMETDLMIPEMRLTELSERKTKVKRSHKCIRCNEFFCNENELATHLHDHTVEDEENKLASEVKCQLCFESFSSLNKLKIHIKGHFCNIKTISSQRRINPEEEQKQVCEKYYCSQCKQEFLTADQCSEHVKRHAVKKIFSCGTCGRVFSRDSSRKRHELKHVEKQFDCPQCGKSFKKRSELRYHISCHVETPPTCDICQKQFQNAQSLKLHRKRHTGESSFVCITCGKNYYSNSELNRHIQIHRGSRDYPCPLCSQSFFSKPELTRHSKYHRGDKKFKCSVCSKSYFESGHLKVHLRVHTGERPFTCDICSKSFISKSKLVRHQKIHSKNRVKKNDNIVGIQRRTI